MPSRCVAVSTECWREKPAAGDWWRPCGAQATLELRNWRPGAIRVSLRARLRSRRTPTAVTISGPGFEDRVVLAATGAQPYARVFEIEGTDTRPVKLAAPREATVSLRAEGAPPAEAERAFELGDVTIETRREIGGVPVNASGGVPARTRH